jgi:hypothetical protein
MATTCEPMIIEGPRGDRNPAAVKPPPMVSERATAHAWYLAGCRPRDSIIFSVARSPLPPKLPFSFCRPWAMIVPPTVVRSTNLASPIVSYLLRIPV